MEKPPKECPTCKKEFNGPWATGDLNKHKARCGVPKPPKPEKVKEKFTCPKCNENFPFRSILEIHKNRKKPCVPVYWSTMTIPTAEEVGDCDKRYVFRLFKLFYDAVEKKNEGNLPYSKHANRPRWSVKFSKEETKEIGLDDFTEMWLNLFFDYFPDEHPKFDDIDTWLMEKECQPYLHPNKKYIIDPVAHAKANIKFTFSRNSLTKIPDDQKDMFEGEYFSSMWNLTQDWLEQNLDS